MVSSSNGGGSGSGANLINLVLNGDLETAKQLIADGADVNSADQHGNSVLHIAAQNGRGGIIDELILNGADVNKGNNHKNTALHLAAQNGWDEVAAKLLRAKKIDVNFKDLHANTALHLAAQNGQIGVRFFCIFYLRRGISFHNLIHLFSGRHWNPLCQL